MIGKSAFEFFLESEQEKAVDLITRIFKFGLVKNEEFVLLKKNKDKFNAEFSCSALFNPEGLPDGIIAITRDISDRKLSEEKIIESERNFRLLFENSPLGIGIFKPDGKIIDVNNSMIKLLGINNRDAFKDFNILTFPRLIFNDFPKNFEICLQKKLPISAEISYRTETLKNIIILFYFIPVSDKYGNVEKVYTLLMDLTEQKMAELSLIQSEEKFFKAFNNSPLILSISEIETGKFIEVNETACLLSGFSKEEILDKTSTEIGWIEKPDRDYIKEIIKKEGRIDRFELSLHAKNGNVIIVEYSAVLIEINSKMVLLSISNDITKRKKDEELLRILNEELLVSKKNLEDNLFRNNILIEELKSAKENLERTNFEKDKLFSIVAHDLRSPFQGFIGMTELLSEDISSFSENELSTIGRELNNNAKNLYKLLENLLLWSRMQQGALPFTPETISLKEIIIHNIDLLVKIGNQKDIKLYTEFDGNLFVYADKEMLNSIFRNLLSNALKFTNRGGFVIINAKKSNGNMVELTIQDSGIGMDENLINNLFKLDKKVGRPGTEGEQSTGLGLLLCNEFVIKNGGKLWVESEIGKGSKFTFTLPSEVLEVL